VSAESLFVIEKALSCRTLGAERYGVAQGGMVEQWQERTEDGREDVHEKRRGDV